MSEPVKLYVYDLSNGLAKQLSLQLTGRQIDGIWHTSIVVFGKEIFYGQGINITAPGKSHHGTPLQIVDLGETGIDEDTFNEYLDEMRTQYTADKYHLLDFNCNSFTNDCAGFLTGNGIPSFVKNLPTDFLSTPFGASLRPTIDAMYRRTPSGGATPTTPAQAPTPNGGLDPALTSSLLQAVAARAQSNTPQQPTPNPATESLTGPIHVCSNSASFQNVLRTHRAVVSYFGDINTCPPCRVIVPVYEDLAREKAIKANGNGAVFTKIDMGTPHGRTLASEWGVRVMPTFMFFLDGKKINEMKGANPTELRTQVDLLLFQAYPPHPHTSFSLPAVQKLSLNPILFTQVPALDTVSAKLASFIDSATWPTNASQSPSQVKSVLSASFVPYLKARSSSSNSGSAPGSSAKPNVLAIWASATDVLVKVLPAESLFPLVDMWRLAFLDPEVGAWSATAQLSPVHVFLDKATTGSPPRNFTLTLLRMLCNTSATPVMAKTMISNVGVTAFLVPTLLHVEAAVRTSAASLAFNLASVVQKARVEKVRDSGASGVVENEDWQVEMTSAIIEAIDRENANEDVVHRLTASLACLLRLSPFYETQMVSLLEVLQARSIISGKLQKGGCGANGITKPDIRALVQEVATKLCP